MHTSYISLLSQAVHCPGSAGMPVCWADRGDQSTDMYTSRHLEDGCKLQHTDHYTDMYPSNLEDRTKLERTDLYAEMYASRLESRAKVDRTDQFADVYNSHLQDRRKSEGSDQFTDMYVSRLDDGGKIEHAEQFVDMYPSVAGDEQRKLASGSDCTSFNSGHSEGSDLQDEALPARVGTNFVSKSEKDVALQIPSASSRKVPYIQCLKCKEKIRERHMVLLNDGRFLHERCLRCEVCLLTIHLSDDRGSVLLRDNKVYCRKDYVQLFSSEPRREMPCCIKCNVQLEKDNWVRRADNYLFHMTCFCCSKCSRQLSKWEQFVMREERLICEKHFYENDGSQKGDSPKPRAKRMRTSFTEEQVKVLQQHFAIDSNPDGQDLERIAKLTGLKKRVTQVWFQNNRARHKKSMQQNSGGQGNPSAFSPAMSASSMYVSANEEGDSAHGNDLGVFSSDVEPQDDGSGHNDFTQQNFWTPMDS